MLNRKIKKSMDPSSKISVTETEVDTNYITEYVAYLDVLGFKEMVYSDNEEDKERLQAYFSIVDYFREAIKQIPEKSKIKIMAVSDSIILSMPENAERSTEQLTHFCIIIGLIQSHLAMSNVWLRGAVTIGKIAHRPKETFILGPAYIEAYELEGKVAKYPRVILDSSLIGELKFATAQDLIDSVNAKINYGNWKGDILYNWCKAKRFNVDLKQDAPLFIDYFQKFFERTEEDSSVKILIGHYLADNIRDKTSVYEKYRWIVDYFLSKFRMSVASKKDEEAYEFLLRL
jgi:hypothetical protein